MKRLVLPALLAVLLHLLLLLIEMPQRGSVQRPERSARSLRMRLVASAGPEKPVHRKDPEKSVDRRPAATHPAPPPSPPTKVAATPKIKPLPPASQPARPVPPPSKPSPAKKRKPSLARRSPTVAAKAIPLEPRINPSDSRAAATTSTAIHRSQEGVKLTAASASEDRRAISPSRPQAADSATDAPGPAATTASVGPARKTPPNRRAHPLYRLCPPPKYPRRARQRGYQGVVSLSVLVDAAGRVKDLKVVRSSGYKSLDRAALKSVRRWVFEPGLENDRHVDMWVEVPIRFSLK